MSSDRIAMDPEILQQHAAKVEQLSGDASEAVSALSSVNLSGGAFGLMCAWMIPPIDAVSSAVSSAIRESGGLISRTATEIRAAAGDFEAHEHAVVDGMRRTEEGFGS